jgi:hypothetical protein
MIPFESIDRVSLTGSGDVWSDDTIKENDFEVIVSGSGDMKFNVETEALESTITGSGDITLSGSTNYLETSVTGSGDFHGFELQANQTDATVTGSGDIEVVANTMLKARVTGSGDIDYHGNPDKEDIKVLGSGDITGN